MTLLVALILRALGWLFLTTALFLPLERLWPLRRGVREAGQLRPNLGWFFINSMVTLPVIGLLAVALARLGLKIAPPGMFAAASGLPLWLRALLIVVVAELGYYWGHRWSHEWPWLWRFHAIHHSPEQLTYLVNTRMHPIDMVFTRLCGALLLAACGLLASETPAGGLIYPLVLVAGSAWSYVIHADVPLRLGPLEHVVTSPHFHHRHHAWSEGPSHNYASLLPVFDRLFGTLDRSAGWPERYGCSEPVPRNLAGQIAYPLERRGS